MIIKMKESATKEEVDTLVEYLQHFNTQVKKIYGEIVTVLGVVGDTASIDIEDVKAITGVEEVT